MVSFWKVKPARSKKYMEWIKTQPCCLTGFRATEYLGVDPHHEEQEGNSGTSTKACDSRCVPIRHDLHQRMENPGHSRASVWSEYGKSPEEEIERLKALWLQQGNKKFW